MLSTRIYIIQAANCEQELCSCDNIAIRHNEQSYETINSIPITVIRCYSSPASYASRIFTKTKKASKSLDFYPTV